MVVPVRRRLRTKTPPAAAQRVPSHGSSAKENENKGPPPQPCPQSQAPAGSGGVPGPGQPGGNDPPDGHGLQMFETVRSIHQDFHLNQEEAHQTMKTMEVIQEEIQKEMMARHPRILIRISLVSSLVNHLEIQILVEMMGTEDVEGEIRFLLRSINGISRYPSWIFLQEYIFRRRVR